MLQSSHVDLTTTVRRPYDNCFKVMKHRRDLTNILRWMYGHYMMSMHLTGYVFIVGMYFLRHGCQSVYF